MIPQGLYNMVISFVMWFRLCLTFLLLTAMSGCYLSTARCPYRYHLPEGYVGWVFICFQEKDAPPLPLEPDGYYLVNVPKEGVVKTFTGFMSCGGGEQFFYVAEGGRRLTRAPSVGVGGTISMYTDETLKTASSMCSFSFVGTEQQFEKHKPLFFDSNDDPKPGAVDPALLN